MRGLVAVDPGGDVERQRVLRDRDRLQPRGPRGGDRPRDQRLAVEVDHRLVGPHPAAAPAREDRGEPPPAAPPPAEDAGHPAPPAPAPSSRRILPCSCSGENGAASFSSAPAAITSRLELSRSST